MYSFIYCLTLFPDTFYKCFFTKGQNIKIKKTIFSWLLFKIEVWLFLCKFFVSMSNYIACFVRQPVCHATKGIISPLFFKIGTWFADQSKICWKVLWFNCHYFLFCFALSFFILLFTLYYSNIIKKIQFLFFLLNKKLSIVGFLS